MTYFFVHEVKVNVFVFFRFIFGILCLYFDRTVVRQEAKWE